MKQCFSRFIELVDKSFLITETIIGEDELTLKFSRKEPRKDDFHLFVDVLNYMDTFLEDSFFSVNHGHVIITVQEKTKREVII